MRSHVAHGLSSTKAILSLRLTPRLQQFPAFLAKGLSVGNMNAIFFLRSGVQDLNVRAQIQNLESNHNAMLRTLGVLYFLFVAEGQGAHP